jgi:hypothetical protein
MTFHTKTDSSRAEHIVRLPDGNIDYDHYRAVARQERRAAIRRAGLRMAARVGSLLSRGGKSAARSADLLSSRATGLSHGPSPSPNSCGGYEPSVRTS